jgi:HAD superfamily hydrolase (TIGR01490 family)
MPSPIAFFDMDYTLLDASSSLLYVKYLRQRGQLKRHQLLRVGWWALLYKLSMMDLMKIMPRIISYAETTDANQALTQSYAWFKDMVAPHIAPRAVERVRSHQQRGHRVVILSASSQFAVQPVAESLGLDFLCTQLEVKDNRLTGSVIEPLCFGEGKIFWARQYAEQHGAQLSDCILYTDSYTDRPLLELIGQPVAVNPDRRLRRLAHQRSWPIENFY